MGRLEDIIDRNRNPKANRERLVVGLGFGLFLLFVLFMMVFTDLGKHPEATDAPPSAPRERRVDDVQIGVPAVRTGSGASSPR